MYRQIPLVETNPVRDIFANGVSSVQLIAPGIRRITFFALQQCTFDARLQRDIVARIIMADAEIDMTRQFVAREMARDFEAANTDNFLRHGH